MFNYFHVYLSLPTSHPLPSLFFPLLQSKVKFSGACAHGQSSRSEHEEQTDVSEWPTLSCHRGWGRGQQPCQGPEELELQWPHALPAITETQEPIAHSGWRWTAFLFGRCCSTSTVIIEADLGKFWLADNQTRGFICFTNKTWFT